MTVPASMTASVEWITDALEAQQGLTGRVYRGRTDSLGDMGQDLFPVVVVRTVSESPTLPKPNALRGSRSIEIAAYQHLPDLDYEPELDALLAAIYASLAPLTKPEAFPAGVTSLSMGEVLYLHPEPGSNLGGVTVNLSVSYALHFPLAAHPLPPDPTPEPEPEPAPAPEPEPEDPAP
jgi:hypothetical protein